MTATSGSSAHVDRHRRWWRLGVRLAGVAIAIAALVVLARVLPVADAIATLQHWVDGLGAIGPLVFGAAYVTAALLFVPGAAMTIAAGALFGLLWGTVVVWTAATIAAGLAFVIARYLARARVAAWARKKPRFRAVDAAIADGGWHVVALLRLVPAYPFSLGNYLFGLTAVRFWPYLIASWLAMLPGTVLYVYVGVLGLHSVEAAGSSVSTWYYALLIAGFVALVGAVGYVTRLARRRLRESEPTLEEER